MSVPNGRPAHADRLARWAWITIALTPAGWALGVVTYLIGVGGTLTIGLLSLNPETWGILLGVAVPVVAVVLAAQAARAGHRSGRRAVLVSGALLLVTLALALLLVPLIGLTAVAVVTVLVIVWARTRNKPSPPTARPRSAPTA